MAPARQKLLAAGKSSTALAASALACLALATGAAGSGSDGKLSAVEAVTVGSVAGALGILAPAPVGVQAGDETVPVEPADAAVTDGVPAVQPDQVAAEQAAPAGPPAPVADLNQTQMTNAWKIVQAGQALGLPKRAFVIAVATSMQESNLYNLASTRIPESYQYNAEGDGSDHDSVGLFQQRPSAGWGAVAELMDPAYSATAFYRVLVTVPGWDSMELTWAAQRVQISAYPYHYAKHEWRAQAVVDAIVP